MKDNKSKFWLLWHWLWMYGIYWEKKVWQKLRWKADKSNLILPTNPFHLPNSKSSTNSRFSLQPLLEKTSWPRKGEKIWRKWDLSETTRQVRWKPLCLGHYWRYSDHIGLIELISSIWQMCLNSRFNSGKHLLISELSIWALPVRGGGWPKSPVWQRVGGG